MRHCSGDARVIPIIVEPCDWASTPLRELRALPRDGKPVSDWTNEKNAYLDVVQELRRVLEVKKVPRGTEQEEATVRPGPSQSGVERYRVKRDFDEIDRSDFREDVFAIIRDYFERAVAEIDAIEDLRGRFVSLSVTSFTCTVVNRARKHGTAHITVHSCRENVGFSDISYSFTENAPANALNGMFTIKADEYDLYLSSSPMMMGRFGRHEERLTPEVVANPDFS